MAAIENPVPIGEFVVFARVEPLAGGPPDVTWIVRRGHVFGKHLGAYATRAAALAEARERAARCVPIIAAPTTAAGRFWQSEQWERVFPAWASCIARVREHDEALADALEDCLADAVAAALAA